jgi:hypothetical protein
VLSKRSSGSHPNSYNLGAMINYMNRNIHISIKDDGIKIRKFIKTPKPIHPESIGKMNEV